MVVAADDVGDGHVMVVHDHRMVVGRRAFAAQDDHVIEFGVADACRALHRVLDHGFAVARRLQADGWRDTRGRIGWIAIPPASVVTWRPTLGGGLFAHLPEFLGRAVAVVGVAGGQHLARDVRMARQAGGLEYRRLVWGE